MIIMFIIRVSIASIIIGIMSMSCIVISVNYMLLLLYYSISMIVTVKHEMFGNRFWLGFSGELPEGKATATACVQCKEHVGYMWSFGHQPSGQPLGKGAPVQYCFRGFPI